jgi:hypothetical protein
MELWLSCGGTRDVVFAKENPADGSQQSGFVPFSDGIINAVHDCFIFKLYYYRRITLALFNGTISITSFGYTMPAILGNHTLLVIFITYN